MVRQLLGDDGDSIIPISGICGISFVPVLFKTLLFSLSFDATTSASNKLAFSKVSQTLLLLFMIKEPQKGHPLLLFLPHCLWLRWLHISFRARPSSQSSLRVQAIWAQGASVPHVLGDQSLFDLPGLLSLIVCSIHSVWGFS